MNEIISLRTANSKTYDLGNNKKRTESSSSQIHYWDTRWKDIDLTIIPCDLFEFEYYCYKNNFIAYFNDATDIVNFNLASFEIKNSRGDSRWINYKLVGATPSKVEVNENRIKYFDCYDGIDVEYIVTTNKLKELITIRDYASYRDVEFTIKLDGCHYTKDESGNIIFFDDETNEELYRITSPFAYDSTFDEENQDYVYGGAEFVLGAINSFESIKVVVDAEWLELATYPVLIDPTTSLQTNASANDGYISAGTFDNALTYVRIGQYSAQVRNVFVRWPNIPVYHGVTIDNAYFQVRAYSTGAGTALTRIFFDDSDNAVAPTDTSLFNAKTRTTSYVDWSPPTQSDGIWYDSPNISSIIQEVVDRVGWSYGNAMQLLWQDNGSSDSNHRRYRTYEYSGNVSGSILVIEWTGAGTEVVLTTSTGADDGVAGAMFDTSDTLAIGDLGGVAVDIFCRFPNVTIPHGAVITSAVIQYTPDATVSSVTCNTRIYLNDVDNATAPTDNTTYAAKVTTTAYVDWIIPSTTLGVTIESPDFSTVVQEVIDRASWASGNALMVVHKNNASTNMAYRTFYSYNTSALSAPKLIVTYTYDGGGGTEYPKTLTVYVDMGSSMLHIVNKKNTANVDSSSVVLHQIGKRATGNIKSFGSFLHGILKKLSAISKTSGSISKHSTFVKIVSTISNMTNNLLHSNGKSLNATSHIYNTVLHYNEKFLDGAVGVGFSIWYSIGKSLISAFDLRSVITRLTGKRLLNISISSGTNKKDSSKRISSNNAVLGTILKSSSKKLLVIIDSLGSFLVQLVTGTQQYLKNLSTNIYTSYFIKKQSDKIPVSLINSSNVLTKSTNKNLLTTAILSVNFFIQSIKIFVKNLAASLTTNNYTQKNTYKANVTEVNINPISKKDTNKKIDTNVGLINLVVKSIIKSFVAGIGLVGRIITNKYQRGNVKIIASIKRHIRVDLVVVARRVDIYSFPRKVDLTFTPRKIEMSTKSRRIDMRIL